MRLFAALLPPPDVVTALRRRVAELTELPGAEALRWTRPPGWHLTLAFYGEIPEDVAPELALRLERAAHRRAPLALRLRGGGHFGDRALWADLAYGDPDHRTHLRRLAGSAAAAGRRVGAPEAERPFHPHLTLARGRPRRPTPLGPFVEALADFTAPPWPAERVSLVRSHPPRSGVPGEQPHYEELASWPLGG
ncbi:RNA 2',3'-cyclic phosphodiesterase [Streptomyces sp. JJ38]|uniref:RNA 2',3'-cyclic phosphodiesterase n=1 Tax=Streptomyces sp. JJ38 TaxID=2738128 RepID=UPI001C584139|nr:RNA 2',3'-cyclic phosphodiesterase [Streptomyces sp. JJ38]MBW1597055.1 RNA 2',3'-cyclic phosphodiesterase [Streptomyces sp. JJ38]